MRLLRILLVLASTGAVSLAQTNAPQVRKMSLQDCIAIAIEHNLDIQIKRFNPELALYALKTVYGDYNPTFSISGGHNLDQSPGGFDQQGRPFGGTQTDENHFSTAFSGLLPWGLTYSLGGSMSDTYGSRPGTTFGSTVTGYTTNQVYDLKGQPSGFQLQTNYEIIQVRERFENAVGKVGFLQLRQPLLKNFWIDNTRLQILLNKKNLKISELDLRSQVMNTVTAVEQAYWNLIYTQDNIEVQRRALELAERLVAENKKRVEVGALAPLDEKQAESQAAASRADLLQAEGTQDTQQRVLKSLLSDDYSEWKDAFIQPTESLFAVPEKFYLQESWRKGLSQRPDLLQEKLTLEKQGYTVRYQKNQLFPQLDLVGTAGYNASSSDFGGALDQFAKRENPFWSVGGEMSIPLGNTAARNNYKTAKATKEQIALQLKQLEQNILIQIENAIATARTSFQRVDATREARIYANAALDAEQKKLESGKSTSFEVLRLQRDLTTARSTEIRALADYNIALSQIALNEGSTLERHKVNLDVK